MQLAHELGADSIVDLGCGTGLITARLARHGFHMIGIDPSPTMLDAALRRPSGAEVTWINGDVSRLGAPNADLAIMSGHVAQFFLTDEEWHAALTFLRAALRPGGALAFETRNRDAREWERWTGDHRRVDHDPEVGSVETWTELDGWRENVASCTNHYRFVDSGAELRSSVQLRFRSEHELHRSLVEAGFAIDREYGDWDRRPAGPATPEAHHRRPTLKLRLGDENVWRDGQRSYPVGCLGS